MHAPSSATPVCSATILFVRRPQVNQLEIDDVIVLLLGAPTTNRFLQNRIDGITRLEKLVFLIERESSLSELITEDSNFIPYNFGPFSEVVYRAVGFLSGYGLVEDSATLVDNTEDSWEERYVLGIDDIDPYTTRIFLLTSRGRQYYEVLVDEIPKEMLSEISYLKEQLGTLPLRQLVRYVYLRYPEMTEQSLIRDEVLGNG